MGKSRQRRQNFSQRRQDCDETPKTQLSQDHQHHDELKEPQQQPQTSSSSTSSNGSGRQSNWAPRNNRTSKLVFVPKSEVGLSQIRDTGNGYQVDEIKSVEKRSLEELNEECDDDDGDDMLRRLEKLQVGVQDVDLSEEQVKINDQAQEDELLAMESIYGDNVYVLEKRQGLRSFQIHVHIELPSELAVSAKLRTSTHSNSKLDGADEFSYTFGVQYLAPILLTCLLPKSYPSHSPLPSQSQCSGYMNLEFPNFV